MYIVYVYVYIIYIFQNPKGPNKTIGSVLRSIIISMDHTSSQNLV